MALSQKRYSSSIGPSFVQWLIVAIGNLNALPVGCHVNWQPSFERGVGDALFEVHL